MMVDPMFMIVHSWRSFLTAVTTTAVALIVVILPEFTWIYLNLPDLHGLLDLPDFPDSPDLSDLLDLPDLPDLPKLPQLPDFTDLPDFPDLPEFT